MFFKIFLESCFGHFQQLGLTLEFYHQFTFYWLTMRKKFFKYKFYSILFNIRDLRRCFDPLEWFHFLTTSIASSIDCSILELWNIQTYRRKGNMYISRLNIQNIIFVNNIFFPLQYIHKHCNIYNRYFNEIDFERK